MAFRADEKAKEGLDEALRYLVGRNIPVTDRENSQSKIIELIDRFGPVIDTYPYWHPLVSTPGHRDPGSPAIRPSHACGYEGLDHTICLRNAFITCPYDGGKRVLESVLNLNRRWNDSMDRYEGTSEIGRALARHAPIASLSAERIDVPLYMPNATPILVSCQWNRPLEFDGTIPKSIAVPLLLEFEMPYWQTSKVAETWETMRNHILGSPRGSRSSLFVNQETGQVLKTFWNSLIYTGMFGPIRV